MLTRTWKVHIHKDRIGDLKHFARTESLVMFKKQAGCLGVFFTLDGNKCATITLWKDMASIVALKSSKSYMDTVEKIVASGIFEGEQSIEIFDCFDGYLKLDDIPKSLQT
jgi:hypothetical protein